MTEQITQQTSQQIRAAVFGGGCFWCTEAVFERLKGVVSVAPGYAGGRRENPTYQEVCGGYTGHAEVIRVEFDPAQISYRDLLTVFFGVHDPTTLNRQGNDTGTQYRSIILYADDQQHQDAEAVINELNSSGAFNGKIVTELKPLATFYEAEKYHHHYFGNNSEQPYCQVVISPKLEKLNKRFKELLKSH